MTMSNPKKIMLLGSGELGKEFVIAAKRLGQYVIAVDSYDHAPTCSTARHWMPSLRNTSRT